MPIAICFPSEEYAAARAHWLIGCVDVVLACLFFGILPRLCAITPLRNNRRSTCARDREREKREEMERDTYIYIYRCRERQTETERERQRERERERQTETERDT